MKYAHLLNVFYADPWHLRSEYWHNFHELLQRAMAGQDVQAHPRSHLAAADRLPELSHFAGAQAQRPIVGPVDRETGTPIVEQMFTAGPVAIIPVHGVLGNKLSLIDLYCGSVDYTHIAQFVRMADGEPGIEAIMFDFDSPGGMSAGCMECAEVIEELSSRKPTFAFVDGKCCSAAYWLASQCKELWATRTSQIGNVGTILAGVDSSANWAQEGYKLELFTSSPLKATGTPGKPWTDADRSYLQERMQQADDRIKNAVKRGRPQMDPTTLDGRWFWAENSVELGVCDAIAADLEQAVTNVIAAMQS